MKYQVPQIEWIEKERENIGGIAIQATTATHTYHIFQGDLDKEWICSYYRHNGGKAKFKILPTSQELKEWVETTHYPSALIKAGFKPVSEPLSDIFDEILQWHEDACENPNYADEMVGRACMAEEFGEWCKSLTYFYEADILRKSAQDLYKSAEHIRATNYGERHFINRKAHLDSLIDLIWVAMQDGYRSGYDMKGALKELIRSNNSKRLSDGTFPRNEAGKIIKTSPTFTDVDLTEFV